MTYQELYQGLNKRASNEQIYKLASLIGMVKKAADDRVPLPKKPTPSTRNNPGPAQAIKGWEGILNPNESRFKTGDINHQYIKNNFSPAAYHAFLDGRLHAPGK